MSAPHPVSTFVAHQWFCDHFGHMNVRHYAAAFDDATFVFWSEMGFVADGKSPMPVTLQTQTQFQQETLAGSVTRISAEVTKIGGKSVGIRFLMQDTRDGTPLASCDVVEVFMNPTTRESCAIPDDIRHRLGPRLVAGSV